MAEDVSGPEGKHVRIRNDPERARATYAALSDRALLDAMRAREPLAVEEFMRRFRFLAIVQAKRLRVPSYERAGWATELLYEVALALCRKDVALPRSIGSYLVTSFRNKAFASRRQRMVRERLEVTEADEVGGNGERVLYSTCSEAALRATYGPDYEQLPLPPVLERLVSALDEGVAAEERALLSWVAKRVPYTVIAHWLGITRSAAIKRVSRLRARLLEATLRFGGELDRAERADLVRFLRRTQAFEDAELEVLLSPTSRKVP